MRICERAQNFVFVDDEQGSVGICGWTRDGHIGKLTENSLSELYNNEAAKAVRERHICGDYSKCFVDGCPYLAMDDIANHSIEYKEQEYPEWLSIAFEHGCNYDCRCCGIIKTNNRNDLELEKKYDRVAEEIKKALPHIKRVYANGCGELFVSKRTLQLLKEWKPEKPEEAEVYLETNGSLFDEKHWKEIENLGKYKLSVAITVMSFDEEIYQFLSGTKLPISQVENNLRFVKSLREKGIVNYFEIATVVQEQNFRGVPEFARRCVEEFGADYVRLRPYQAWASETPEQAWFTDIRNPEHPYYTEYRRVMSHPYLVNPKVHDWSGGNDTAIPIRFPYKDELYKEKIITDLVLNIEKIAEQFSRCASPLYIYGMGYIGKVLTKELAHYGISVCGIFDRDPSMEKFCNIPVYSLDKLKTIPKEANIIVTPIVRAGEVYKMLSEYGLNNTISVKKLISDSDLYEEVKNL